MDLLSGLNEPQRRAVVHETGPLLIFAGAGSGKTRTLTHRIAYLIEEYKVPTGRILAVTFTNKAAREMRERLEALIGPRAKTMWLGTFHALCAKMLRIHGERIGLNPRFAIFDADDQTRLVKDILKELNIDSERFPAARVKGRISDAKNLLKSPETVASEATKPHEKVYASLYARYQERLRMASALDFDDLLSEAVRLLNQSAESLEYWSERFQHVLIDEFQDVNEAQFQWASLLASKHKNICVVGDDDQCLAAGTLVTTPDGDKPIEEIKAGDLVLSGVGEGYARFHEVKEVKSKQHTGTILRITTDTEDKIRVTPNHICFSNNFEYKENDEKECVSLLSFAKFDKKKQISSHLVFTKDSEDHLEDNLDCAEEFALNLARSRGGLSIKHYAVFDGFHVLDFMTAAELKIGMFVPVTKKGFFSQFSKKSLGHIGKSEITDIEEEHYDGLVYDLDIPEARNFAANGVLVHNSIYAWRGADVKIILDFEKRYPDAQIVRLEQNYRSTQNILDAAHSVIANNFGRAAKRLWTEESGGEKLTLHGALNAQEEAYYVVRQIQQLQRDEHLKLSDFSILCRINAQSRPFEEAFIRNRVPLKLVGTQRFYERREIRDVLAYLKFLYNPDDNVSAIRLINVPPRGIGAATVAKLEALAALGERSIGAVLLGGSLSKSLTPAVARKIEPLQRVLMTLFTDARAVGTLADLTEKILERTQLLDYLERSNDGEGVDRVANVEEFVRACEGFDLRLAEEIGEDGESSDVWSEDDPLRLGQFLSETALEGGTDKDAQSDDAVTLMTLHAAKGLEFPVVFLSGLEQGLLPHSRAVFGESATPEQLEEERRLMYVGLTRARKRAVLTYAAQRTLHGRTETTTPSQFLDEIPAELLKKEGIAAGGSRLVQKRSTAWDSLSRPSNGYGSKSNNYDNPNPFGTPPTPPKSAPAEPPQFKVGDKISHASLGEGVVVAAATQGGAGEWVEVAFFGGAGKKKLIVAYANLKKVG
ncbi:intein C-terminal splicing region/intein N-terminal splicing region [Abditibacterium utsteinense]|uniref:DNA 3'-5' helicase n=1 Tax=Abditibacterium utsteinense TaxID=1960156 RepID=A0A2S8SQL4_9BACT|nr:UvrD-helicase domain-containing protein [Abditibacterium utsteinense]PQV63076.1 intein C-terminal splicing region/intein N-terminal splicing region [Abditibacterium utsteinense]